MSAAAAAPAGRLEAARERTLDLVEPLSAEDHLDEVRSRALEALAGADLSDDAGPLTAGGVVFDVLAQHEAQHSETLLQCLQMLPAGREMRTEISCEFTREMVAPMHDHAGLRLLEWHQDPRGWFAVSPARRA